MESGDKQTLSRRHVLGISLLTGAGCMLPKPSLARPSPAKLTLSGNPLKLPAGVCDPQVRVYDNMIWLYATHDASPENNTFTMNDWQIWRSNDLVTWSLAGTLHPENTYFRRPSSQCWATDAARRDGRYYLYFSMGPEDIGVVVSDTPAGPWTDPLNKPLIAKGQVPTASRDPGILQDLDGADYIVFGTFDYYIARLNKDMISLSEEPKLIQITDKDGPYGIGKTDDKPFLHRHGDTYYLSWGTYYATSKSPYGPFHGKGPLLIASNVDQPFLNDSAMRGPHAPPPQYRPRNWLNFDRHGSFFEWRDRWFFVCNDQSQPGTTPLFRRSVICDVRYLENGDIAPLALRRQGVEVPRP